MKKPELIQLPKILDRRGNLTFIEGNQHIPFKINRTYWIYDVPGGETRGGHAFKEQQEFIIALSGSFDVVLDDATERKVYNLNRSYYGLYVPNGIWRQLDNFSTNSLALVLASTIFDENDYIRNYEEFAHFSLTSSIFKQQKLSVVENKVIEDDNFSCISTIDECYVMPLEINHREKGNITVIENKGIVPFDIERVYYLYDVPGGVERGGHAHLELCQLIVAASGSFDVVLNDGTNKKTITLNRPYQGLYIVPGIWRELENFSSGSNCLVLASTHYEENDYIRDYDDFINLKSRR